jgi:hypothetical protein
MDIHWHARPHLKISGGKNEVEAEEYSLFVRLRGK